MDPPPQQGHHIEDASENSEMLRSVLKVLAESAGFSLGEIWDETRVRTCLEATGGVVDAAADMYWDDFLAREALSGPRNNAGANNDAAAEDSDMEEGDAIFPQQQHLVQQEARAVVVPVPRVHNNDDSGDEPPVNVGSVGRAGRSRRRGRRRAPPVRFEDELVVSDLSDDEAIVEKAKKKTKKVKAISPCFRRQKIDQDDDANLSDDEKDGYISDTDWLWKSMVPHDGDRTEGASDFLWGNSEDGVPNTWVSAGVRVSKLGGVFVQAPNDSDIGHSEWKESSVQGIPAPYHCRSITLVNSIVTALLYTGVGIQPGPCIAVGQQPLIEIVDKLDDMNPNELRKRLIDAVTTLLHIAATSSADRKRKALESMLMSENAHKWQKIQQKLKLVPTFALSRSSDEPNYKVSYSNIQDLKCYVDSTIDSFTRSGGLAMLLDLIVSIHGVSALQRMHSSDKGSIVRCSCWKRFVPSDKVELQRLKSLTKESPKLDTTPRDLECISRSTDVLNLLLAGKINATASELDQACKLLGIGIISQDGDFPPNPMAKVWLVRGPTQWSVLLWESGDFSHSHPVAKFRHLSLWYGDDNITRIQLSIRGTSDTFPSDDSAPIAHEDDIKYYPNKYRLWRYKFAEKDEWCSYHLLKPNQQRAVEDSVGPRLAVLLRRQWPGVTIDSISHHEPVV